MTLSQVADLLGTSERIPRRLIAERRIRFVRVERHVRVSGSAPRAFHRCEVGGADALVARPENSMTQKRRFGRVRQLPQAAGRGYLGPDGIAIPLLRRFPPRRMRRFGSR